MTSVPGEGNGGGVVDGARLGVGAAVRAGVAAGAGVADGAAAAPGVGAGVGEAAAPQPPARRATTARATTVRIAERISDALPRLQSHQWIGAVPAPLSATFAAEGATHQSRTAGPRPPGQDLAVVSKLLGHSDLGTTSDVYAHLTLRMSRDASERVDRLLGIG